MTSEDRGRGGCSGQTPSNAELSDICSTARSLFGVPSALYVLTGREHSNPVSGEGSAVLEEVLCAAVDGSTGTLVIADVSRDARFCGAPSVVGGPSIRFFAGAPVMLDSGRQAGVLGLFDTKPHAF